MPFLARKSEGSSVEALPKTREFKDGPRRNEDQYKSSNVAAGRNTPGLAATWGQSERRLCSNPECVSGWMLPWRNRRRPIFEGRWCCSGRCVLAMVQTSLRRELGGGVTAAPLTPHRHRVPLGLVMLAQGWITHPELQRALAAQRDSGTGRIGDWLMSHCGLEAEQITRGLGMQWGCPVLTTERFFPETMALVIPKVFVERFGVLPLRVAASRILYLGFADRLDASAALAIEQMTELKVESGVVEGAEFESARDKLLASVGVWTNLEITEDKNTMAARIVAVLEQQRPIASRLVRVHEYFWLRLWLESGAIGKGGNLPVTTEDVRDYVFTVGAQG